MKANEGIYALPGLSTFCQVIRARINNNKFNSDQYTKRFGKNFKDIMSILDYVTNEPLMYKFG